ncbi:hypothetical protein [Christiangramia sp.]|uniref:hypothetical protein n=1 Tax=Christiangramia sp. TaxID=1931228 RepID=UPI0026375713|nr:hypothetical protein [Christiangramia sp.]
MSWKDKIENGIFKITTGDGKTFRPLWKPGESSIEFNTSAYSFINLEGTLVDRKKPQSSKYPLVFWFQGEDHLDEVKTFLNASKDSRAWEIEHPIYGIINGQPISIKRNDVNYNITEISVEFWESISVDYPDDDISVSDRIQAKSVLVRSEAVKTYLGFQPATSDIATTKRTTVQIAADLIKLAGDKKVDYENTANTAVKSVDKLISSQEATIREQQGIFTSFVGFDASVKRKVNFIKNSIQTLFENTEKRSDKFLYESQAATAISCLCEAAVNPVALDYISRADIDEVVNAIIEVHGNYLQTLDAAQVSRYDIENTWNPDVNLQLSLNDLVVDTIGSLQTLAFEAKQERIVYTEKATNLIILTHRYLGLDINDENLERFRKINNIKNEELFSVKKGRQIKYFA